MCRIGSLCTFDLTIDGGGASRRVTWIPRQHSARLLEITRPVVCGGEGFTRAPSCRADCQTPRLAITIVFSEPFFPGGGGGGGGFPPGGTKIRLFCRVRLALIYKIKGFIPLFASLLRAPQAKFFPAFWSLQTRFPQGKSMIYGGLVEGDLGSDRSKSRGGGEGIVGGW